MNSLKTNDFLSPQVAMRSDFPVGVKWSAKCLAAWILHLILVEMAPTGDSDKPWVVVEILSVIDRFEE